MVVVLTPLAEFRQDLGKQAQGEEEDVDGTFRLVDLMPCMIPRVMNTLLMITDIYIPMESERTDAGLDRRKIIKCRKRKIPMLAWPLLVPLLTQLA